MTSVPITLQCGADWWMELAYTDGSGNPINITSPRMEIRAASVDGVPTHGTVLYSSETNPATIVLTLPAGNTVKASIAGSLTKDLSNQVGVWDCYATDPNGLTVLLGSGSFQSVPNVTEL